MKIPAVLALVVASMTMSAPAAGAAVVVDAITVEAVGSELRDRVVVTYDAPVSAWKLNNETDVAGLTYANQVSDDVKTYVLDREVAGATARELLTDLEKAPGVVRVEFDMHTETAASPNDPFWNNQWNLRNGYGVDAESAWNETDGSGVTVGVIDNGIRGAHEDLVGQWVGGYDFISDPVTANDGDGWDADATDPGDWDTVAECGEAGTSSWHGSHVSGIIAAKRGNAKGVAGVASGAHILPVRTLGRCGGSMSDTIIGLQWAAGLSVGGAPVNPNPAKIINMSLGASGACPIWVQNAIDEVTAAGTLVVVAAGNDDTSATLYTPASCDNVLTVAATTSTGEKSWFSNWGSAVSLAAPGSSIASSVDTGTTTPVGDGYVGYSGTSMASPHVAAVAALVVALQPDITPEALATRLMSTTTAFQFASSCALICGAGIVNAKNAVAATLSYIRPGAPVSVAATPAGARLNVTWGAPASAGTSPISTYSVRLDGTERCSVAGTSCDIPGLTKGSTHDVEVFATNAAGTGPASAKVPVTYATSPGVPVGVQASVAGTTATVRWAVPADDGGSALGEYRVEGTPTGSCTTSGTTCVFSGLVPGVAYSYSVWAQNSYGYSGASAAATIQVAAGSTPPSGVTTAVSQGAVTVSWTPGAGGLAADSYVATSTPGGLSCASYSTGCVITGLSPGMNYSIVVSAVPAVGAAGYSQAVSVSIPSTPPKTVAPYKMKKGARVLLTKVLTSSARGTKTWRTTGGCRISGRYLIAPKRAATCVVTLTVKNTKTTTTKRTVKVS
jgi:serine protease